MPCYHPIPARQEAGGGVRLHPPVGEANLSLPCGTCIGCRKVRATEWARRCMHEAADFDHNSFVTLTYDDAHLPKHGHLVPEHLQLFLKRLRRVHFRCLSDGVLGLRFFGSGEYGELSGRPHYHLLLFNCAFPDAEVVGADLWSSPMLSELWRYGDNKIGKVSGASANYVAQYSMKKLGSRLHCDAYGVERPAPFLRMSRRPGIGRRFVDRYASDLENGYLVVDGRRTRMPRAYKKILAPDVVAMFEAKMAAARVVCPSDRNDPARLADGEYIAYQQFDSHTL